MGLKTCEGYRPDIIHLDQSMMTYEWFKITQQKHIKNVVLPKPVYHPYKPEGYSFLEFLVTNWDVGPIFLCGGCGILLTYDMILRLACGIACFSAAGVVDFQKAKLHALAHIARVDRSCAGFSMLPCMEEGNLMGRGGYCDR